MDTSKIKIEVTKADLVAAVNAYFWPGQEGPLQDAETDSVVFSGVPTPPPAPIPLTWDDEGGDE